jgi:hypothetical protein
MRTQFFELLALTLWVLEFLAVIRPQSPLHMSGRVGDPTTYWYMALCVDSLSIHKASKLWRSGTSKLELTLLGYLVGFNQLEMWAFKGWVLYKGPPFLLNTMSDFVWLVNYMASPNSEILKTNHSWSRMGTSSKGNKPYCISIYGQLSN